MLEGGYKGGLKGLVGFERVSDRFFVVFGVGEEGLCY